MTNKLSTTYSMMVFINNTVCYMLGKIRMQQIGKKEAGPNVI